MVAGKVMRSGFVLDILKGKSRRCHLRLDMGILVSSTAITEHHTFGGFEHHKLTIL